MTAAFSRSILIMLFCSVQLILSAQPFPTQADHDREVDSLQKILMVAKKDTGKVNTLISLTESLLWWSEEERPKALTPMEEAIKLAKELSFPKGLAKTLDLKGTYYLNQYNKEQALKYYRESLAVRKQINDKQGMVGSYMNIAYIEAEKYDEKIKLYLDALKLAKETGDKKIIGGVYESLGLLSMDEAFYRQALKYYTEYLKIAQEVQDHDMLFTAHNQLGLINIQMGNYNEALSHFFSAEKVRKYASNWANIALVYILQGNYPEALKFHYAALARNTEKGDKQRIIRNKSSIGSIYVTETAELLKKSRNIDTISKKLELAKNYLLPSLEFYQQNSDKGGLAGVYRSLGEYYKVEAQFMSFKKERIDSVEKKLTQAENFYLNTLKIYEELQDWYSIHSGKPLAWKDLGSFYKTQAEIFQNYKVDKIKTEKLLAKAGDYYFKAIKFHSDSSQRDQLPDSYIQAGRILTDQASFANDSSSQKKFDKAIFYLNKGLSMARDIGLRRDVLKAYEALGETNKAMKDYKSGLEYLNLYVSVKDSLVNDESIVKTSELTAQYLTEKKEAEEKIKQAKIKMEQERRNMLIIMIGSFIFLSLIFAILLFRQKDHKRREIEKANNNRKMAELELQSLRAQLNPHFMFNSLNAIQELILKEDNDNSHLYLSRFSDLLRMLLENANQPFVTLRKEINLLELYLSLENLRIPDLQYSIEIDPSIDSNKITIPNMILQPYIENAIWHGLSHKKGERNLTIRITKEANGIACEVKDNGVGRKMAAELKSLYRKEHRSKGMELLSKRFILLSKEYGSEIQTTVEDLHDNGTATGTRVAIMVPSSLTGQTQLVYS